MLQAMALSEQLGWLTSQDVERAKKLILQAKLPTEPPKIAVQTALDLMGHDKKVKSGKIRLVLLKQLGEAVLTADYPAQLLTDVLNPQ